MKSSAAKTVKADPETPRRGRPAKITRERLAEAASELGIADFKLAQVASRLEVTLQTLYNHVKDREELLHLAAEVLEEQYPFPKDLDMEWIEWWRSWAYSLKRLYRRTPGLASILMTRPLVNFPPLTHHWEAAQAVAERFGFTPDTALWANLAVHEFIYAWAAREDQTKRQKVNRRKAIIDDTFATQSPRFANAVKLVEKRSFDERFDMSLRALLAGLASLRDGETTKLKETA